MGFISFLGRTFILQFDRTVLAAIIFLCVKRVTRLTHTEPMKMRLTKHL